MLKDKHQKEACCVAFGSIDNGAGAEIMPVKSHLNYNLLSYLLLICCLSSKLG